MRATIDIDLDLEQQLHQAQDLTRERQATVIRLALRAGLPLVIDRFQPPRPEGYFASAYKKSTRVRFKQKMAKLPQEAER